MKNSPLTIQRVYLVLLLLNTLAASLIWGINTLFLLDAGLSNTQAFLANAFFTIGQVLFEVPTGMVADTRGRRTSYLLGTITLALSTALYLFAWYVSAGLWLWAVSSVLLGLGFTFFSGATEAWLVDALEFSGYKGKLEDVFAKGQVIGGLAMLVGSVGGGVIAQFTSISVPYILRAVLLIVNFAVAWLYMRDLGFSPEKSVDLVGDFKKLFINSFTFSWNRPAIRWVMLAAPFTAGVGFYTFYALQPFLLELYQDKEAYAVAGLAAAIVAGSQMVGGMLVPRLSNVFQKRTSVVISSIIASSMILVVVGMLGNFWLALVLLCGWGLVFAVSEPVRKAYLNGLIPSQKRATVLSFDNLMASSGGVVIQPGLGQVADVWSYGASLVIGAVIQVLAVPFICLARSEKPESDVLENERGKKNASSRN